MNNNEITYFLLYTFDTKELYAYSSDKKEIKKFLKFRDDSKFIKRKVLMDIDNRKHISIHHSDKRIRDYKFNISGVNVSIPLTYKEILEIETNKVNHDIYLVAISTVDPNIFTKKILGYLFDIGYTDSWMRWKYGGELKDNSFIIFMNIYGAYMNLHEIKKKAFKNIIGGNKNEKV